MLSNLIGRICQSIIGRLVQGISLLGINPNFLTFIGFIVTLMAAGFLAQGKFLHAGIVIILSGIFDILDGKVARKTNTVTTFGAFFDSVLDRYSDMALFLGLIIHYSSSQQTIYVVLSGIVMMGAVMTSYTRARAESLIPSCKVGFLERPERLVLLIIGTLFNKMAPVLWIMSVMSNLTVAHRIFQTWDQTSKVTSPQDPATFSASEVSTPTSQDPK